MRLARHQRARLLDHDYRPLMWDTKPFGAAKGVTYVLSREAGEPVWWIELHEPVRRSDGRWMCGFNVNDIRDRPRLLRRSPPVMDPEQLRDASHLEESVRASEDSAYTASRWSAMDDLEAVPRDWQEAVALEARARDLEDAVERSFRERSKAMGERRRRRAA